MDDDRSICCSSESLKETEFNDLIRQFASFVNDFSSQYGREDGFAFTALNLVGKLSRFPSYGDYGECFVLRTYGPWWKMLKSFIRSSKKEVYGFISKDFIELKFNKRVWINFIDIYETYHPGSIVAIYTYDYGSSKWTKIWSIFYEQDFKNNNDARRRLLPPKSSRKFCPNLIDTHIFSDLIRLEFEDTNQQYSSGFDGVELWGTFDKPNSREKSDKNKRTFENNNHSNKNSINITDLPTDILSVLFEKLDLESLLKLRLTCRYFYSVCSDNIIYKEIDLQPYWYFVNDSFIWTLTKICQQINYLNLSWTKNLSTYLLKQLFYGSAQQITILKLACCSYITDDVIEYICYYCTNITEFDVQSCKNFKNFFPIGRLQHLQNLNLYRTNCDTLGIVKILTCCKKLLYLNLGSCVMIDAFDYLLSVIANDCPNIIGLDLWRASSISYRGIQKLSESCHALEELDLGWIKIERFECLQMLIQNCRRLKKLCLAGVRITNVELNLIANFCPNIEQLDIIGSLNVTLNQVENVLNACKKLKLFDISFCPSIDMITARSLSQKYPHCSIKKSFQN